MPPEHLLRHVLLVPTGIGLGVALLFLLAGNARRRGWLGLALGAGFAAALELHPNFALRLPPRDAGSALPFAALAFALAALVPLSDGLRRPLLARGALFAVPAGWLAWLSAAPVRGFYGWSALELAGVVLLGAAGGAASALLARAVAAKHPAHGALAAWIVAGAGASLAILFGRWAVGAEYAGVLCAVLGPTLLLALLRGGDRRAEPYAAPVAGALFAALFYAALQAELIWISAALLVLLAPAAGLLTLRSRSAWSTVGALGLVTLLPAAAAVFLSLMKAQTA